MKKIRVNVSVDEKLLRDAKKKLGLFGGKVSTLFNAYLNDFVKSAAGGGGAVSEKIKELEKRIEKLEKKN